MRLREETCGRESDTPKKSEGFERSGEKMVKVLPENCKTGAFQHSGTCLGSTCSFESSYPSRVNLRCPQRSGYFGKVIGAVFSDIQPSQCVDAIVGEVD